MQPRGAFAVPVKARVAAQVAWRGLIQVATAPDSAPVWLWRAPWQRRAVYSALSAVALVLGLVSLVSLVDGPTSRDIVVRQVGRGLPRLVHQGDIGESRPLVLVALALLALLAVLPLVLAVRYPMLGWRIAWLAFLLMPLSSSYWWGGWPWYPVQVPILLVVYCVAGIRQQRAVLWWMWGLMLAVWWLWSGTGRPDVVAHVLGTAALTALTFALDSISSRRSALAALTVLSERTELKQARLTVLEERARIARELHDVVAHHMSLIAVRAESAPYRIDDLPEPVRAEFSALGAAARDALTDMRRLLGVLRQDQAADRAPQPPLADLPVLIGAARHAGVPVELSVRADLAEVPAGVGVCAYRIVQESLSNAGQHAPGEPVIRIRVEASSAPPVRFNGVIWVRPGPTTRRGNREDERILNERRRSLDGPFDSRPVPSSSLAAMDLEVVRSTYLPAVVDPEVIAENQRSLEQQLASIRFTDPAGVPTVLGLLVAGFDPGDYIPGAYIQFVRYQGEDLGAAVADDQEIRAHLINASIRLEAVLRANLRTKLVQVTDFREASSPDYPIEALREVCMNAIMHRNYETSYAPVRIAWFDDRVEISNPGGPFGQVRQDNFDRVNDYRNPSLAAAMKSLGYVNRFGRGIGRIRVAVERNGNPPADFLVDDSSWTVILRSNS